MKRVFIIVFIALSTISFTVNASVFELVTPVSKVSIVYAKDDARLTSIVANLLAHDIQMVSGYRPGVTSDFSTVSGNVIVIGTVKSLLLKKLDKDYFNNLDGRWECYSYRLVSNLNKNIKNALIIAGSDLRGTAYGVFGISEKIGVSPWYWWSDVNPAKQERLLLNVTDFTSHTPSVRFRGIFINDEDWGLQPWAAKTFEPETKDIGPKTYAKVFELLLRLRANLIWPAMHPSTKAFYYYPGNKQVAADYDIIVGTSHAEPMLRNNVDEWDKKTMGDFNYVTNKANVLKYWESRIKESSVNNVIYTMGMRGIHDGQMEGIKSTREAVPLLETIFEDQRNLLRKYINPEIKSVPQVFTLYKEVLDIYENGLKVPDDITLIWPDDNYGYIQRLSTAEEKKRSGGSGVYYHASYWGRPHDYLWLGSTHPALVREEMKKAFDAGADRLWVLNVGDIKPLEYNIQQFMDMAYNINAFKENDDTQKHLRKWVDGIFGKENADSIARVLWKYYQLAFERRPEFMGWSQTEPTTQTSYSSYNHFSYGDEAQLRIERYEALEKAVKSLRKDISPIHKAAFYQLVYYPVVGAGWMNKKFLYRDKAFLYAQQNRISAYGYAEMSKAAYDSIVQETVRFNKELSGGKWDGIMSMHPRDLPVYQAPVLPQIFIKKNMGWDVVPEGYDTIAYKEQRKKILPSFIIGERQAYFLDVFLTDSASLAWRAKCSSGWIRLSNQKGTLVPKRGQNSVRVWVTIDWTRVPAVARAEGSIDIWANKKKVTIGVSALRPTVTGFVSYKGFSEQNGIVSIHAAHYSSRRDKPDGQWKTLQGLGHTDTSLLSSVNTAQLSTDVDTTFIRQHAAHVSYTFYSFSQSAPKLFVYSLPTHPLNKNFGMRYAVSVDDGPVKIIDFKTTGRSEEWKENVLRNVAIKELQLAALNPGKHSLQIYAIDPGVILDRIVIVFGNVPLGYSVIPETWKN